MAYIVKIKKGTEKPYTLAFEQLPIRIGRTQLNEVVLDEPYVSHFHGIVQFEGDVPTYMDLGSTNGTEVNGHKAPGHTTVTLLGGLKDEIAIGEIQLAVSSAAVPLHLLEHSRSPSTGVAGSFTATLLRSAEGEGPAVGRKPRALLKTQLLSPAEARGPDHDPAALAAFVKRIRPAYEASRRASSELAKQARAGLAELDAADRPAAAQQALHELEWLASEPELLALFREQDVDLGARAPVDALDWLRRLTHQDDPSGDDPYEDVSAALAMERVGAVLETFASALVELRRGYEQFGSEMGLRVVHDDTELYEAEDARAVLRYVLDPSRDGNEAVAGLKGVFLDLAVHQVALLSGVMSGVRDLLLEMSPGKLSGAKSAALAVRGGLLSRLFPYKSAALWWRYSGTHAAIVEEDRFTRTVFGRAFARAYFAVTGGRLEREASGGRSG